MKILKILPILLVLGCEKSEDSSLPYLELLNKILHNDAKVPKECQIKTFVYQANEDLYNVEYILTWQGKDQTFETSDDIQVSCETQLEKINLKSLFEEIVLSEKLGTEDELNEKYKDKTVLFDGFLARLNKIDEYYVIFAESKEATQYAFLVNARFLSFQKDLPIGVRVGAVGKIRRVDSVGILLHQGWIEIVTFPAKPIRKELVEVASIKYSILTMLGECTYWKEMPKYRKAVADAYQDGVITNEEFYDLIELYSKPLAIDSKLEEVNLNLSKDQFERVLEEWRKENYTKDLDN